MVALRFCHNLVANKKTNAPTAGTIRLDLVVGATPKLRCMKIRQWTVSVCDDDDDGQTMGAPQQWTLCGQTETECTQKRIAPLWQLWSCLSNVVIHDFRLI